MDSKLVGINHCEAPYSMPQSIILDRNQPQTWSSEF